MEKNYKRDKRRDGQETSTAGNTSAMAPGTTGPALRQPQSFQKRSPEFVPSPTTTTVMATQNQIPREFFINEDGERCTWGKDARYKDSKTFHPSRYFERRLRPSGAEVYGFPRRKQTLREINKSKPLHISKLISHPSEPNWAHPLGHPRHIFSFPPEILDNIFSHVLTVSAFADSIQPLPITSNRVSYWQQPFYSTRIEKLDHGIINPFRTHVARILRTDASGPYLELRKVMLPAIDATFLRASKTVYELGINFLYQQPMYFKMTNPSLHSSPPTSLDGRTDYKPDASKPYFFSDSDFPPLFEQIRQRAPLHRLPGWVYYSPFLRFLWTIGPKNAARLKTITFEGTIKLHECDNQDHHRACMYTDCHHDLANCLRLYIPFIREFCNGVEKITLIVQKDRFFRKKFSREEAAELDDREWAREVARLEERENAILPLLENDIRTVKSLKELRVVRWERRDEVLDCAEETIRWFKDRATGGAKQAPDQEADLEPKVPAKVKSGNQEEPKVSRTHAADPETRIGTLDGVKALHTVDEEDSGAECEETEPKPEKKPGTGKKPSRKQRAKKKKQGLVQESKSGSSQELKARLGGLDGNLSESESESELESGGSDSHTSSSNCSLVDSTPPAEVATATPETLLEEFNSNSTSSLESNPSLLTETEIANAPESESVSLTPPNQDEPDTPEPCSEIASPNLLLLESSFLNKPDTIPFPDFYIADSMPSTEEDPPTPQIISYQDSNPLTSTQTLPEEPDISIPAALTTHKRKPQKQSQRTPSSKNSKSKKKKSKQSTREIQQPLEPSLISRILDSQRLKLGMVGGLIIIALYLLYLGAVEA